MKVFSPSQQSEANKFVMLNKSHNCVLLLLLLLLLSI